MKKICVVVSAVLLVTLLAIVVGVGLRWSGSKGEDGSGPQVEVNTAPVKRDRSSTPGAEHKEVTSAFGGYLGPMLIDTVHGTRMKELPSERTTKETTEMDLVYQADDGSTLRVNGHRSKATPPVHPLPSPPTEEEVPIRRENEKVYEKMGKADLMEIPAEDDDREHGVLPKSVQKTVKKKYDPSEYQDDEDEEEGQEDVAMPSRITDVEIRSGGRQKANIRQKRDDFEEYLLEEEADMDFLMANVEELEKNSTVI
uniref:Transmembrane protein n=1 Tax=Steinernema glaseri TaxID=37863 RepID=A0A1I7ZSX7_9BILA